MSTVEGEVEAFNFHIKVLQFLHRNDQDKSGDHHSQGVHVY